MKIKDPKEKAKVSAQVGHSGGVSHHISAQKVQKKKLKGELKKARKPQQNARQLLQRTMNTIHALSNGHQARLTARRWIRHQLDSKLIPGQTANELWHFLKDRKLAGVTKGAIEKDDLSEEAKAVWIRYLQELAIPAGVQLNVEAIFAGVATGQDASDAMEGGEEEDDGVMLSPEPGDVDEEAATEREDERDGGVLLGPFALRPKQEKM